MPSRRGFLAGSAALPASAALAKVPEDPVARVAADLEHYIGFGSKQAGGPGDTACGAWLTAEIEKLGFKVEQQPVSVPYFLPERADLRCGDAKASVWPQPIVVPTPAEGITGPLVRIDGAGRPAGPLAEAVALLELPYARWSTTIARPVREPITAAFAAGAKAVVVITNGPTGKVIALNADGRKPMFAGPVALLAPADAGPFLAAAIAATPATLTVTGENGRRPASNFIGRLDRGKKSWLAVSTPRSGWTTCAGERGGGIAAWLWLARWASKAVPQHNLAFICNTGHEYENLGAAEALKATAPKPADTHFWLHLGANVASQEWHDLTGQVLPSVDTQRFLSVSPALLPLARALFAGHVGFEAPYSSDKLSAGEQIEILAAGYPSVAAIFGLHRYHHVQGDDARCVSAANVARAAAQFQTLIERVTR
ncbi:twin-arginine translocation signal domain-containing protein [Sphingomonas sp. R-74633]|uniref:twin-arginine translocation signal domain-containing protein n=1 Tax=Sphingomonas sp. R-74633 TaxID=2751188 RepID=UPI0015D430BE|nr:twin-arginine translocation signal domain-containing protein [Sphingomonas sp. R-74633]NYT42399.1 twin-arginine translocation signal domain-containing protein [Sphingomonas sp. R-74633]